jgi:hypothetical protein
MEQLTDKLVDRRIPDMVVVVQHEDEWLSDAAQFIHQRGNKIVNRRRLGRVQQSGGVGASARECRVDRGDEVAEEDGQVVVRFIEREPRDRPANVFQPLDDGCRLAGARGRHDQRQRSVRPLR